MAKQTAAKAAWLKQHGAAERALFKVLKQTFDDQTKRITAALKDFSTITPSVIPQVLRPTDEHTLFMAVVSDPLVRIMAAGAVAQLAAVEKGRKTTKADVFQPFDLPKNVKDAILTNFNELAEQDYWAEIQATTSEQLTSIVNQGIEEGLNNWEMTKRINEALDGLSKIRSANIARTETTGAFNAGHQVVYDELATAGLISGKTWSTTMDKSTRETHWALDSVTIGAKEDFSVGGEPAPYPGHWSLSARERCNCRCTTIAAFPEEGAAATAVSSEEEA